MKDSIEEIWKEGFLSEKSLVVPKINDLYNQKSMHLVDKIKRMFKINLRAINIAALIIPIMYYFIDALWHGIVIGVVLVLIAWYQKKIFKSLEPFDQSLNSLEYLKMFDNWIKDAFSRSGKVVRFIYPMMFIIVSSAVWSAWTKNDKLILEIKSEYPDLTFVGNVPLVALISVLIITAAMFYYSDKIYRFDVRIIYGRVFDKLENTISEMEELKG